MVKGNAYGHGDQRVTKALIETGISRVGVISIEEALGLRESGVGCEILIFSRFSKSAAKEVIQHKFTPVISALRDLEDLASFKTPVDVHLKFDTGMHRMGFDLPMVAQLKEFFLKNLQVKVTAVCTHLSQGSDVANTNGFSQKQLGKLVGALKEFGAVIPHALNSDAMIAGQDSRPDLVQRWGARPGLAIYGLHSWPKLKAAMQLFSQLDLVRHVPKGESVSYGGRWTASRDSIIGVVPIGYGDGYFRSFGGKSSMLFREQRVPVVGTVCMDYSLLDLTDASVQAAPQVGEEVVIFGSQGKETITVSELTDLVSTIPYELVTGLSARIPRVYK
jgi:alanine racemase